MHHCLLNAESPWREEGRLIQVAEGLRAKGDFVAEAPVQQPPRLSPTDLDAARPPGSTGESAAPQSSGPAAQPPSALQSRAQWQQDPHEDPTQTLAKYVEKRTPKVSIPSLPIFLSAILPLKSRPHTPRAAKGSVVISARHAVGIVGMFCFLSKLERLTAWSVLCCSAHLPVPQAAGAAKPSM